MSSMPSGSSARPSGRVTDVKGVAPASTRVSLRLVLPVLDQGHLFAGYKRRERRRRLGVAAQTRLFVDAREVQQLGELSVAHHVVDRIVATRPMTRLAL